MVVCSVFVVCRMVFCFLFGNKMILMCHCHCHCQIFIIAIYLFWSQCQICWIYIYLGFILYDRSPFFFVYFLWMLSSCCLCWSFKSLNVRTFCYWLNIWTIFHYFVIFFFFFIWLNIKKILCSQHIWWARKSICYLITLISVWEKTLRQN